mmetsp:Transcript_25543/g.64259  ORF Transcript_25543/g.64259 Transcript_25543/m.64259 type:complete len:263 (-) Transcript_25543:563-1351(-)
MTSHVLNLAGGARASAEPPGPAPSSAAVAGVRRPLISSSSALCVEARTSTGLIVSRCSSATRYLRSSHDSHASRARRLWNLKMAVYRLQPGLGRMMVEPTNSWQLKLVAAAPRSLSTASNSANLSGWTWWLTMMLIGPSILTSGSVLAASLARISLDRCAASRMYASSFSTASISMAAASAPLLMPPRLLAPPASAASSSSPTASAGWPGCTAPVPTASPLSCVAGGAAAAGRATFLGRRHGKPSYSVSMGSTLHSQWRGRL